MELVGIYETLGREEMRDYTVRIQSHKINVLEVWPDATLREGEGHGVSCCQASLELAMYLRMISSF